MSTATLKDVRLLQSWNITRHWWKMCRC